MRFDLEVRIARPVADVFAYVSDVTNLPSWQESAVNAEWIEPRARFRERRSFLGHRAELELEVTAYEPDRRFDVKAVSGPVRFEVSHALTAADGGTLLRVTAHASGLAASMAKRQAERQFRSDLDRLKDVLEGQRRDEESPSDRPPRPADK
jgi:uncharacterized protein YndB with AHSA1/START domain